VSTSLRIALLCPHAWPPRDDVAHHVAAEAAALARRGHRVTILAPATGRERLAAGRALLSAARAGDAGSLSPAGPGVLEVAVGRAVLTGPGRRLGEPFDLAGALEAALSGRAFDVVHLHEPLAPSPALAALRHAPGVTAATFHRAELLAGVAFLRPLLDRALVRTRLRITTSDAARRALADILPGDYTLVAPGVDAAALAPPPERGGPPGLLLVARGRDRVGARFALGLLRGLDLSALGPVTLLGPADAPWRTRAAVPKALRGTVTVVPDEGPAARARTLTSARIAVIADPTDAAGPVLAEALAAGCAVLAPRCPATDENVVHGADGLVLPPFSRDAWIAAIAQLVADPQRRARLSAGARSRARSWDDEAADLEREYRRALAGGSARPGDARVLADLRVRMGPALGPEQLMAACRARGIDVVGVASPEGLAPALAARDAAPADVTVIVGQEVATAEGALVGLFLSDEVAGGMSCAETAAAIHAQGGLVMVPDPAASDAPAPVVLRTLGPAVDCHETRDEPASWARLRRLGLLPCAGSGAERPGEVGSHLTEMRPVHGAPDLLEALADARAPRPRRRRRRVPAS
jgi:glycosyltransferase involved in cell wall biosynthesis